MIECRQGSRLSLEAVEPLLVSGEIGWQHFDGDLPTELGIFREIDFSHPSNTELFEDLVVAERLANHSQDL